MGAFGEVTRRTGRRLASTNNPEVPCLGMVPPSASSTSLF